MGRRRVFYWFKCFLPAFAALGGGGVSTLCARMARGCADNMKVQEAPCVTPLIREPVTPPMRDGTERQRRGGVWRGGGGQTMHKYAIYSA